MADPLIDALLERYSRPADGALDLAGDLRRPDLINALAQPSTTDVLAQYRAPWGGIKSYLPDQPEPMRIAQGYAAQGLRAINGLSDRLPPMVGDLILAGLLGPRARLPARNLTLSENLQQALRPERMTTPEGHPQFYYHLLDNGQKIGSATGHVAGDTAHLNWLGATGLENTLGLSAIRQLREAFARDFPDVRTFAGDRSSGARAQDIGSKMQADRKQSVAFPKTDDQ